MKTANFVASLENLFLISLRAVWNIARRFNPRPLQQYFAARPAVGSIVISKVYNAEEADSGESICRVANNLIKSETNPKGIFERGQLIKVYNPANKRFAVLYAMGAGSHGIARNAISIDYDARRALGIAKVCKGDGEVELMIGKANIGDAEYFHMYTDHEKSSRSARQLGWILFAYGFVWSVVGLAQSAIAGAAALLGLL